MGMDGLNVILNGIVKIIIFLLGSGVKRILEFIIHRAITFCTVRHRRCLVYPPGTSMYTEEYRLRPSETPKPRRVVIHSHVC